MENDKVLNLVENMFNVFNTRFDYLEKTLDTRFEQIDTRFDQMDTRLGKMDARFDKMDARLGKMDQRIDTLEGTINKTNLMIENIIIPKLDALFDGYIQHTEQINRLEEKVDNLQSDVTYLSIKTLAQDTKITDLYKRVKLT